MSSDLLVQPRPFEYASSQSLASEDVADQLVAALALILMVLVLPLTLPLTLPLALLGAWG